MQYSVLIQYDATDEIYVARVPELSGCIVHSHTRKGAIKEIQNAIQLYLEVAKEKGMEIPAPAEYIS